MLQNLFKNCFAHISISQMYATIGKNIVWQNIIHLLLFLLLANGKKCKHKTELTNTTLSEVTHSQGEAIYYDKMRIYKIANT